MGVTVTFVAVLELMREGLIEIVQSEAYGQIHVRTATAARHLKLVEGGAVEAVDAYAVDADAENEAALAQPAQPEEEDAEDHDVSTNEDSMTPAVPRADNPDPEASK